MALEDQPSLATKTTKIPLISLPSGVSDLKETAPQLVEALQRSGFLLVTSPALPEELQASALKAANKVLLREKSGTVATEGGGGVIEHPSDPKVYMMLESLEEISKKCEEEEQSKILRGYWQGLEQVKRQVLTCIAIGLDLEPDYFVNLHSKNQSCLRLLHYPKKGTEDGGLVVRGKAHSDYGSVTLLLTDGVPGLQALVDDEWTSVPYVKGALTVNIGSLLHDWTNGKLLATLHRVISVDEGKPRTSLAFFADPDPDISATLKDPSGMIPTAGMHKSVAEYIQWRSGGKGRQRSGLAFSKEEEERAKRARKS